MHSLLHGKPPLESSCQKERTHPLLGALTCIYKWLPPFLHYSYMHIYWLFPLGSFFFLLCVSLCCLRNQNMEGGIPEAVMNSGERIPLIGMGTSSPSTPPDVFISAFITAMEVGYRHFDTAATYGSEAPLGKAIALALQEGLIKTRGELFITSKLGCTDAHHDRVLPALKQTLQCVNPINKPRARRGHLTLPHILSLYFSSRGHTHG